jgi:hypothetical protein
MKKRRFSFGKYKGKTITSICTKDPEYITWVKDNVRWFSLIPVENKLYEQNKRQESQDWDDEFYGLTEEDLFNN